MRYELAGAVGRVEVLTPLAAVHPRARLIRLDVAGLALVPVTAPFADAVTPAMICAISGPGVTHPRQSTARPAAALLTGPESGFARLTPGLLSLLEAASRTGPVAYLEAEYLAQEGHQTAAVWRDGALVLGPLLLGRSEPFVSAEAPITHALQLLGVRREGRSDEFVVAGLGRCRRTVDWT